MAELHREESRLLPIGNGRVLPKIVITETLDKVCVRWLDQRADVTWCSLDDRSFLDTQLPTADGLVIRTYTQVDDQLLDRTDRLRVIGRAGVGLDNIDLAACARRNIPVVYTPDANTRSVVEYVLGLILDDLRPRSSLLAPVDGTTFHQLRKEQVGTQLDELTLGILGFGRIGQRLGSVANALGMKLVVNDLRPESEVRAKVTFPFEFVDKSTLYERSNILTIHIDGRQNNRHLINADVLSQLRPDCLLINAARGMLVDNGALLDWCQGVADQGGRAVLDVHDPEPIPQDYPLFGLPNIRLLPHIASRTTTALRNMSWVVRDVMSVLEGKEPQYPAR